MIFIHCAGNGDIYTTDSQSGVVTEFASYEEAATAAAWQSAQSTDMTHGVAWFSERDAADFYFYDFIWGEALESITVPVGAFGQQITFHKPARQLIR